MQFRVLTGKNPGKLTDACLEEISGENVLWPQKRAFMIVPEQIKADMERRFLETRQFLGDVSETDSHALMLIDVVSFHRFCYRILSEIGGFSENYLDEVTRTLLLYRILSEERDSFSALSSLSGKISMVPEIDSILGDFQRSKVTPEKLEALNIEKLEPSLQKKVSDFSKLIRRFSQWSEELGYEDQTREMDYVFRVLERLSDSQNCGKWPWNRLSYLKDTSIWIMGFGQTRGFTPQEWDMIKSLNRICEKVTVCITTDFIPERESDIYCGSDVFYFGRHTLFQIMNEYPGVQIWNTENKGENLVNANQEAISDSKSISVKNESIANQKLLASNALAEFFAERKQPEQQKKAEGMEILRFESPAEEMYFVAGEIKRLVLTENYRFRDIRIVLCNPAAYESHLYSVFHEFGLDPFLDKKRALSETPFMRFILAFLDMQVNGWSFASLMICMKSGLCHVTLPEVDRLENYCLRYGLFKGYRILDKKFFMKTGDPEAYILWKLVERVLYPLKEYADQLLHAKKCNEKARIMKIFLAEYGSVSHPELKGMAAQIQTIADHWKEEQNQEHAISIVASFQQFILLLDKLEGPVGATDISAKEFRNMLESGMSAAFSGAIPSYTDQIEITDLRRAYLRSGKILFLVGANGQTFPYRKVQEGYLRGKERAVLENVLKINLPSRSRDQIYSDSFIAYAILKSVEEKIYISYESKDTPSRLVHVAESSFSNIQIQTAETDNLDFHDSRLFSHASLGRHVRSILHQGEVVQDFKKAKQIADLYPTLGHSGSYYGEYSDTPVPEELILKRFDENAGMSVSQIESYTACPFYYFSTYILGLKEREEFQVKLNDVGTFLHKILELAMEDYKSALETAESPLQKEQVCRSFSERDYQEWSESLFHQSVRDIPLPVTNESVFWGNTARKIIRIGKWSLQGIFSINTDEMPIPAHLEWRFGNENELVLKTENGRNLRFRGVIDRVDMQKENQQFSIVDYKSGNKSVEYNALYHGLSLQLPAYIYAFHKANPMLHPADAGYFHLTAPMKTLNPDTEFYDESAIEKNNQKTFQLRGMGLDSEGLEMVSVYAVGKMQEQVEKIF